MKITYMGYVDRKVKVAYEEGFERGKFVEARSQALERNLDMIREKLAQTPGKQKCKISNSQG